MKVRIGGLITADKFYRIDARLTGNGESLSLCLSALERSKHDDGGDNEPNSPEHKVLGVAAREILVRDRPRLD